MTALEEEIQLPMLTPAAAAKKTGLPVSVIRRAMVTGKLAYTQPNGERGWRLIDQHDLIAWLGSIRVERKR